ncbi:hypothetical protein AGMMS50229_19650 [Campylobacterota bacterium]|nr:hypothetical protein AGMMS50229_19650 [Campylobacterota bacterium]
MRMIITALIALLLAGCGANTSSAPKPTAARSQTAAPEWVKGTTSAYPSSRYLVGVGSGANQNTAGDRARSDLGKSLSVTVMSSESSRTTGGIDSYESVFSSAVYAQSEQTIEGVEIAERWLDETTELYYALAVLDRSRASSRLRSLVSQKELEIAALQREASGVGDPLGRLSLLNDALKLCAQRLADTAVLAVLDDRGVAPYETQNEISAAKRELLRTIKLSVTGDSVAKSLLSNALSKAGFAIVPLAQSDYEVTGSFESGVRSENNWQWASATIATKITERATDTEKLNELFSVKEAATSVENAKERALNKLRDTLANDLPTAIGKK